ncbi:hypothetical protein LLH03_04815 [bacterium]|nr:hypothetical protein [bacterium]
MMRPSLFLPLPFLLLSPCLAQQPSLKLATNRPGNLYDYLTPVTVSVSATGLTAPQWTLMDFDRKTAASGKVSLTDGKGTISLGRLPLGYYELTCAEGPTTARLPLGVIRDHSAAPPRDTRLNTDSSIVWNSRREDFEALAQILRIAGVGWARDRFSWGGTEPQKGVIDYQQYDPCAEAYAKAGVRHYSLFHDTPGWTRGNNPATKNPTDLREVYAFTKRLAQHYKGRVRAWEIWNEPDIPHFWPDLGDTLAGLQKAAYLGFKAGDPDLMILQSSFCRGYCNFDECLMEAGAKDYFDIFNWHVYAPPEGYPRVLGQYLELLDRYGCADRPVWLSEAGIRVEATEPGGELNAAAERAQAEFVPKCFAYSLAAGTDRAFFFIYPYYLERGVQFGSMRRDLSPRPGFIAIAAAVDLLGEAKYLGQYPLEKASALAFETPRGKVLVVWSEKPQTVEFAAPATVKVADLFGRETNPALSEGKLNLTAGPAPQYVIGLGDDLTAHLTGEVRPAGKLPDNHPCPVVVRGQAQVPTIDKARNCYLITSEPFKYTVEVCNLTDAAPARGEIALEVPAGWTSEPRKVTVSLEPMGRAVLEFTLSGEVPVGSVRKVWVRPSFPGVQGTTVQPSVSYLGLDANRVKPRETLDLKLGDPKRWVVNVAGNGKQEIVAGSEGGIRSTISFAGPGDRWCYPQAKFDPPADFSHYDGIAFEYRCHGDDDSTVVRPQLIEQGGSLYHIMSDWKATQAWTTRQFPFSDTEWASFSAADANGKLDLDKIVSLRLGLNTTKDKVWLEVRNVRLIKF